MLLQTLLKFHFENIISIVRQLAAPKHQISHGCGFASLDLDWSSVAQVVCKLPHLSKLPLVFHIFDRLCLELSNLFFPNFDVLRYDVCLIIHTDQF